MQGCEITPREIASMEERKAYGLRQAARRQGNRYRAIDNALKRRRTVEYGDCLRSKPGEYRQLASYHEFQPPRSCCHLSHRAWHAITNDSYSCRRQMRCRHYGVRIYTPIDCLGPFSCLRNCWQTEASIKGMSAAGKHAVVRRHSRHDLALTDCVERHD